MKIHLRRIYVWLGTLLSFFVVVGSVNANVCQSPTDAVNGTLSPPSVDFVIVYTDNSIGDLDYYSDELAELIGFDFLPSIYSTYLDPPFSLPTPSYVGNPPLAICVLRTDPFGYVAKALSNHELHFPNNNRNFPASIFGILAHEMFHFEQLAVFPYEAFDAYGLWQSEGIPDLMVDRFGVPGPSNAPQEQDTKFNSEYYKRVTDYLENPERSLFGIDYDAALFWNYVVEQLGVETSEPARGVDFVRRYYQIVKGYLPDRTSFRPLLDTIKEFDSNETFMNLWMDFAITNYTHDFDIGDVDDPARFSYVDESSAGGGRNRQIADDNGILELHNFYGPVKVTEVQPGSPSGSANMAEYSARYFESDLREAGVGSCQVMGFKGTAQSGTKPAWGLVGVESSNNLRGRVTEIHRAIGDEFYGALIQKPASPSFERLALVVAGLAKEGSVSWSFASGNLNGTVGLPTSESNRTKAFVGDPTGTGEKFQVRLRLTGPAGLTPAGDGIVSVKGLDRHVRENLNVKLRSSSTGTLYGALVQTSAYVSGEYWLVVDAPSIDAATDGILYDLEICLCGTTSTCAVPLVSMDSVEYSEQQINEVLVLDRSGSMNYPQLTNKTKLAAAKVAANLYVTAASDDDNLSLVTFNGNLAECDDDSESPFAALQDVQTKRNLVRDEIDLVTASGRTSIGDGLKRARDQLLAASGSADLDLIVLLSDGIGNEADYWDRFSGFPCFTPAVSDSFDSGQPAEDIFIDTIAFGPGTDQDRLFQIADATGGLYYPVATDFPSGLPFSASTQGTGASGAALSAATTTMNPEPDMLEVSNRLAQTYRSIQERAADQNRLFYAATQLDTAANTQVIVPVTEREGGGIRNAQFVVNWAFPGLGVTTALLDPNAVAITDSTPGWSVEQHDTSIVFNYANVLDPGNWTIKLSTVDAAQAITMVSGQIVEGVDFDVQLSQIRPLGPAPVCRRFSYRFLRGLPVTILATLVDGAGPIPHATVEARVRNPDGSYNRLSLYDDGAHDDGNPGDGVYGGLYTRTPFFSRGGSGDDPPTDPTAPPVGPWGSYIVQVFGFGDSNLGESFLRYQETGFHVFEFDPNVEQGCDPDLDKDGLPDRWETLYGLDPGDPNDKLLDNDNDRLDNTKEFEQGTLPLDGDTDDGGEADGSEVSGGLDPLYDKDDRMPPLVNYGVITRLGHAGTIQLLPQTNWLRFELEAQYQSLQIWRTDPSWSGFERVATIDLSADRSGLYKDDGLQNGFTYQYYLIAEGQTEVFTEPSNTFMGTPKAEPTNPEGELVLNHGSSMSDSRDVLVTWIFASEDVVDMRFAEDSDLGAAPWVPFNNQFDFMFDPVIGAGPWSASFYAQLRDGAGNVSELVSAVIDVDENGDFDMDGIINSLDPDDDNDGLSDQLELDVFGYNTFNPDTDGDGLPDPQEDFDLDLVNNIDEINQNTDPTMNMADFNGDGIYDAGDVNDFRNAHQLGDATADVNNDGNVDQTDIDLFTAAYMNVRQFYDD